MIPYPDIDPIAIHLGPIAIRWYALAYLMGVLSGWWLVGKLNKRYMPPIISKEAYDDMTMWAIFGIILGGRLGYVLFYKPDYYFFHLQEVLMVWQGGMSFHGGLLGMICAMYLFSRKYNAPFMGVMDVLSVAAPIGLCLGRLANFVNGELFGRVTDSDWGMIFPSGGPLPRYPSQLIEAGLEGVLLFIIMLLLAFRTPILRYRGKLSGCFLIGYALARSTAELFRQPDAFIGYLAGGVTMGQVLSFPMVLVGIFLVIRHAKTDSVSTEAA